MTRLAKRYKIFVLDCPIHKLRAYKKHKMDFTFLCQYLDFTLLCQYQFIYVVIATRVI